MDAIQLETLRWPVVIVRPMRKPTDVELDEFLVRYHQFVDHRTDSYAIVLDLRQLSDMPPAQRKRLTESMRASRSHERCRGCAMVFTSAALRMVLTAIFWFFKPKYPTEVFSTDVEALQWARSQVGGSLPIRSASGM